MYDIYGYRKDSFDRFGDDLTELILSFLWFEDKIRLECVSKQWKRCVFQRQSVIELNFFRERKNQNSLNGLFRRNDDERQSDEQRLVSVMKKCQNIKRIIMRKITEDEFMRIMLYHYPDAQVNNAQDLLNINPKVWPSSQKRDNLNEIEYVLNSNRYAFDSEVLSLFGQYCPNIKSLDITTINSKDLKFFRIYGHNFQVINIYGNIVEKKDFLKFCPNLKTIYVYQSYLFSEDKDLPKLENIRTHLTFYSSNVNELKILSDKYCQIMKILHLSLYISDEEVKTCIECISRFENLRHLKIHFYPLKTEQPIEDCFSLIGQKFTKLLKLHLFIINNSVPMSKRFLYTFTHFKSLEYLKINLWTKTVMSGSVECFKHCKQLIDIDIDYNQLKENFFTNISTFVPKLQLLRIITEQKFSDSFIDSFHSMKNIQKVFLPYNKKIGISVKVCQK